MGSVPQQHAHSDDIVGPHPAPAPAPKNAAKPTPAPPNFSSYLTINDKVSMKKKERERGGKKVGGRQGLNTLGKDFLPGARPVSDRLQI